MVTTNIIEGKKPSGLMLPPMGILETVPCVKDAPYITYDLALSSVRLAKGPWRERALCKSMLKIKQQVHRGAYLLRDKNTHQDPNVVTAPFEALYGQKCKSPVWAEVGNVQLTGPEFT
ncbi:hypothetical protein Tco_0099016 [Tanacetum coccineum]